MLQKLAFLASHILHQVTGHKAQVLLDLLDQPVTILQVQMSKAQDFFQVVGKQSAANVESLFISQKNLPLDCFHDGLAFKEWSDVGRAL